MSRFRAILFDVDHTLLDFDRAQRAALRAAFAELALPFGPATLGAYREINDAIWAEYRRGEISQRALARERFRRLLKRLGAAPAQATTLSAAFLDQLGRRGDCLPGCRAALARLAKAYRLGVVTNGIDRVQRSRLRAAGLDRFFEVVVTSAGCGYAKPDPRILHVALRALGLPAREALYVGDDPGVDGAAAAGARVAFCWIDSGTAPSGRRPRRRVTSLHALADRLL